MPQILKKLTPSTIQNIFCKISFIKIKIPHMYFTQLNKLKLEFTLLAIGFIFILIYNYLAEFTFNTQMNTLLALVFVVGVPHGALDFLVDEQNQIRSNKIFSLNKFLFIYLSQLFAFALFWFLPTIAFAIFIIFSIFHFGETDLAFLVKPNKNCWSLYAAYGTLILSILLLTHLPEVTAAVPLLGSFLKSNTAILFLQNNTYYILLAIFILFFATFFWHYKKNNLKKIEFTRILMFTLLIAILIALPMLLAFTFYFALWHSIISIRNIFSYFKQSAQLSKVSNFWGKSILFSVIALVGIVVLYVVAKYFLPDMNLLFALLIVLSVLTLPHLKVMHTMYLNANNAS